jgi:hypothetical protein
MKRTPSASHAAMSEDREALFLIVDDEDVVSCVPPTKRAAEERLRELQSTHLRGSYGQRRAFRLIEVNEDTYEAAVRRYIYRYRPPLQLSKR